jgi:hypothetical protein
MIQPLPILLWALLVGATAAGMIVALRVMPGIRGLVKEGKKPWACDICMPVWTVGPLTALLAWWQNDVLLICVAGPAYPLAMWLLRRLTDPPEHPPLLLEDSDAEKS